MNRIEKAKLAQREKDADKACRFLADMLLREGPMYLMPEVQKLRECIMKED